MATKHIAPANFHYVAVGGQGALEPRLPDSFLPDRQSPVLCRYDVCELTESYARRHLFPALSDPIPDTPTFARMCDVPKGLYSGYNSKPYPAGLGLLNYLFRSVFEIYGSSVGVNFRFLDPGVTLSGIAAKFSGHYVGRAAADSGVKTATVTKYTPLENGQYDSATVTGDPVRTHSESIVRKTVPEVMPLPCVNDFTWDVEVSTETVNGVQVRLPKHHLHYQLEKDRTGRKHGDYDTVGDSSLVSMHACSALSLLPSAVRTHKEGFPTSDPDLVDSDDDVDMYTARSAVEQADNVDAGSIRAVDGDAGTSSTSFSVVPKPFYRMDFWTHYGVNEDYGGSVKLKESAKMFRPPGLFPTLPATFLAGDIETIDPGEGDPYRTVDRYYPAWWPDADMKRQLDSALEETYRYVSEHFPEGWADAYKDNGVDCLVANAHGRSLGSGSVTVADRPFYHQGTSFVHDMVSMPPCIPDVLYTHPFKSAYAWRDRLVKTLHEVDLHKVLYTETETVDSSYPDDQYENQVRQTGSRTYRGTLMGSASSKPPNLPGGKAGYSSPVDFYSLPAASHNVNEYIGYLDRGNTYSRSISSRFSGTLVLSGFTPIRELNGCPETVKATRKGSSTTTRVSDDPPEPVTTTFEDDPVDNSSQESLVSRFIPDDRWPFIKEARLFAVVDVSVYALVGGWAERMYNYEADYKEYEERYENGRVVSFTGRDGTYTNTDATHTLAAGASGSFVIDLGAIDPQTGAAPGSINVYSLLEGLRCQDPSYAGDSEALQEVFRGFGPYKVTRDGMFNHSFSRTTGGTTVTWEPPLDNPGAGVPATYTGKRTSVRNVTSVDGFCGQSSNIATNYSFDARFQLHKLFVAIEWDFEADGS